MIYSDKLIEVQWNRRNKKHFVDLGYEYTNMGESFSIKQVDLPSGSRVKVSVKCDYCTNDYFCSMADYNNYFRKNPQLLKTACGKCKHLKQEELNILKYGVKTNLLLDSTKEKIMKTNLEKYGVDNPAKNIDVQEKMRETNMKKYGTEYVSQNKEIRQKQIKTTQEKYGCDYSILNDEVKEKSRKTLYENKVAPTSRTQLYLNHLLKGVLNYPVGSCNIDILLDDKIALEYDGGGHNLQVKFGTITEEEFVKIERARDFFLKRRGYKILRIVSKRDRLPDDNILMESVNLCVEYLNNGGSNAEINIDEGFIRKGKDKADYSFGYLLRKDKVYFERIKTPTT